MTQSGVEMACGREEKLDGVLTWDHHKSYVYIYASQNIGGASFVRASGGEICCCTLARTMTRLTPRNSNNHLIASSLVQFS